MAKKSAEDELNHRMRMLVTNIAEVDYEDSLTAKERAELVDAVMEEDEDTIYRVVSALISDTLASGDDDGEEADEDDEESDEKDEEDVGGKEEFVEAEVIDIGKKKRASR